MNITITIPAEIANKVSRQNLVNKKTNEIINSLIPVFDSLVGKKIKKTSGYGGFTKATEEILNPLMERLSVHFKFSYSSFVIRIVYKEGESYSDYITEELTIGRVDTQTGILTDMILTKDLRKTDYSVDEIYMNMLQKEELETRLQEVSSKIPYFLR